MAINEEQVLALAGVALAGLQVQLVARRGEDDLEMQTMLFNSLRVTSPKRTLDVYQPSDKLKQGLAILKHQLGDSPRKDAELTRYVVSMLTLERKLSAKPNAMQELGDRISQLERQLAHFDITDEQVVTNLASIYSDVVSPLGPKIQVAGNPNLLSQKHTQSKVRALLLTGIRSAVLWRQLGGKRRTILFNRKKILAAIDAVLPQFD